jgi:hypothetical protein
MEGMDRFAGVNRTAVPGLPRHHVERRILTEALDRVAPAHRAARLATLRRPGERLVEYLVEEVVAASDPAVRELLALASPLAGLASPVPVVSPALCDAAVRRFTEHRRPVEALRVVRARQDPVALAEHLLRH